MPETYNVIINPRHADAMRIKGLTSFPYPLDSRLRSEKILSKFDLACACRRTPSTVHDRACESGIPPASRGIQEPQPSLRMIRLSISCHWADLNGRSCRPGGLALGDATSLATREVGEMKGNWAQNERTNHVCKTKGNNQRRPMLR